MKIDALKLSARVDTADGQKQAQLREAARQFEALFVKQLLKHVDMSAGLGGENQARADFVNAMWRDNISEQMSSGSGLGLAQMLVRQMGGDADMTLNPRGVSLGGLPAGGPSAANLYQQHATEPSKFDDQREFVSQLKPLLEKAAQELGVSPRILLAQAALETGWGQHMPRDGDGASSRNLFGIKADAAWRGPAVNAATLEYEAGEAARLRDDFRQYLSFADSVRDYVEFLHANPRYEKALQHGGSDKNFLQGLKSAGYATDPHYVDKVMAVADSPVMARLWNEV